MTQFTNSQKAYKEAVELMPGGVNSPVRAFQSVGMDPIFMQEGKGSKITDIDGNTYIDYVLSWGPLILGHTDDRVVQAIQETATKGSSFGAPTLQETKLAKLVQERVPSLEMMRLVSSGTEATMSALRVARGYTGRDIIVKFEGNYHGHGDSLLIKAGSGVATLGLPDSPGVPSSIAKNTITAPYNDRERMKEIFAAYGDQIAGVIVEPVAGNMGVVPAKKEFLQTLRSLTSEHGAVLIFDEVMSGFRVGYYSAQGHYGITPDMTCLGKVIGGGLPVGAYGGKKKIMKNVAPAGTIYQAGTLSGNPLAMTAGYETISALTDNEYTYMNTIIDQLVAGYEKASKTYGIPIQVNRAGSMVGVFFTDREVTDYETAKQSDVDAFASYYKTMIEEGVFLPPSQFEGLFVSTAHTEEDIQQTVAAVEKAFDKLRSNK